MNNSELLERFRELEARLQKVNTELDGLRVAIKGRTFTEKKAALKRRLFSSLPLSTEGIIKAKAKQAAKNSCHRGRIVVEYISRTCPPP